MNANDLPSELVIHLEDIGNHANQPVSNEMIENNDTSKNSTSNLDHQPSKEAKKSFFNSFDILIILILLIIIIIIILILATIKKKRNYQLPNQTLYEFLYINDLHIDPKYIPSSSSQTFCREYDSNYDSQPFHFGQYSCDTPILTFNSMLRFLTKKLYTSNKSPKFILIGGDVPAHALGYPMNQMHSFIGDIVSNISLSFNSKIPLIFVLGNNEYVPNYGNDDFSSDKANFESLYEHVIGPYILNDSTLDQDYINEQKSTFLKGGYYYYDIPECHLRILSVNSIIYNLYRVTTVDNNDPYGQFEWILSTAFKAKNEYNYSVGISLHIPPGMTYTTGEYSRVSQGWHSHYIEKFDEVVAKADIDFILAAHSHYDMMLPVNGKESSSKLFSLAAPSVSPQHLNNPGFRIFKIKENGKIDDYDQYYADIMKNPQPRLHKTPINKSSVHQKTKFKSILANPYIYYKNDDQTEIGLKWFLSYSFKSAYGNKKKEFVDYYSDFDDYDDDLLFETKKVIQSDRNEPEIGVNKETLLNVVDWIGSTSEGRWRYKERVCNLAADYGLFYYCILTCTTVDQLHECLGPQYDDATYETLQYLLPYNGERL